MKLELEPIEANKESEIHLEQNKKPDNFNNQNQSIDSSIQNSYDKNPSNENSNFNNEVIYAEAYAYYEDVSKPENEKKAYLLFKKAAIAGYAPAQTSLGVLYETGYGVDYHPEQAVNWYKKASNNGDEQGMVNLARMLLQGEGIKYDREEAKFWLEKALRKGNSDAREMLDYMEENKPSNFKQKVLQVILFLSIIPWAIFSVTTIMPLFTAMGLEKIKLGLLIAIVLLPLLLLYKLINIFIED